MFFFVFFFCFFFGGGGAVGVGGAAPVAEWLRALIFHYRT